MSLGTGAKSTLLIVTQAYTLNAGTIRENWLVTLKRTGGKFATGTAGRAVWTRATARKSLVHLRVYPDLIARQYSQMRLMKCYYDYHLSGEKNKRFEIMRFANAYGAKFVIRNRNDGKCVTVNGLNQDCKPLWNPWR